MTPEQILAAIRAALGLDGEADPVEAIAGLNERVANAERAVREGGEAIVDRAELIRLQSEVNDAQRRLLTADSEAQRELVEARRRVRELEADVEVGKLQAAGRVRKVHADIARNLYLTTPRERWEDTVALFPSIDLTERGIAVGADLEGLAPTASDIAVAKALGNWNDADPAGSKRRIMDAKAREQGLTLPEGYEAKA